MAGYTRTDTTNNIADGNIINATDLDNEFDGIQAAFNSSTGHNHDGTTGEGAPILVLGPTQDVVVGAAAVTPKTTNTVDIGSGSLKFKDLYMAGNASVGGTLAVTGVATLTAQPVLSSLTASRAVFTDGSKGLVSNAITGTGNVVMSASPTLTGTIGGENATLSGTLAVTGVATLTAQPIVSSLTASRAVFSDGSKGLVSNAITGTGNVVMSASPTLTGTINAEALTTSSTVTHNAGTANGVAYLNASKVLTTGSALVFDSSGNLGLGVTPSAWGTDNSVRVFQNAAGSLWNFSTTFQILGQNYYRASSGQRLYSTTAAATDYIQTAGQHQWFTAPSGTAGDAISFTQALTLDASGFLMLGTTTALRRLTVESATAPIAVRNSGSTAGKRWDIGPEGSSNTFVVYNQDSVGVYITDGGTSWTANSDERLKDIIEPISDAANKVASLRAVIGKYKTDAIGVRRSFLIAQDVQSVLPEAVSVKEDEIGTLGVQYSEVIPLLVAAIKELKIEFDAYKAAHP